MMNHRRLHHLVPSAAAIRCARPGARSLAAFALSLGMALAAFAPAAHSTPLETRTVVVRFGDLDLTRADGVAALHVRLRRAARAVCPFDHGPSVRANDAARRCYDRALGRALIDVQLNAQQRLVTLPRCAS